MSWEYHQGPVDGKKNKKHDQGNYIINKICLADEWPLIDMETDLMAGYVEQIAAFLKHWANTTQ